ncbi:hypothetical protein FB451DRAFT_519647 [Mycena latifolia]|nr:hypothetical protein FB451DRAFT_519647 [Mycena latifolia]
MSQYAALVTLYSPSPRRVRARLIPAHAPGALATSSRPPPLPIRACPAACMRRTLGWWTPDPHALSPDSEDAPTTQSTVRARRAVLATRARDGQSSERGCADGRAAPPVPACLSPAAARPVDVESQRDPAQPSQPSLSVWWMWLSCRLCPTPAPPAPRLARACTRGGPNYAVHTRPLRSLRPNHPPPLTYRLPSPYRFVEIFAATGYAL